MTPRAVVAATSGNVLEWYDFTVYGFLAPTIGRVFFPSEDHVASLLSAFAVLAVGYAARPIGSIIYGHIGDRFGRKPALLSSVTLMGVGSVLIGILPTHAQIGVTASVLLVLIRVLQGISVAGEYSASGVLIVEEARKESRGLVGSWIACAMMLGCVLGSGVPALITAFLSEEQISAWGWRIPFFLGAVIAICGVILRRHMTELPIKDRAQAAPGLPIVAALRNHGTTIVRMICLILVNAVGFYMLFVYAASYLTARMHISTAHALDINTLSLLVMLPATPLAAIWSDRIGRKPLLYVVAIGTLVLSWPLWWLMHHQSLALILAGQVGFALLFAAGYAVTSAVMVETLPAEVRCSGVAIGYNLCLAVFGGTTPLIATYLVARTADDFAPVYYLMATALISLIATFRLPETAGRPLD